MKKSTRLRAFAIRIFVLALVLAAIFHTFSINKVKSQERPFYFIPLQNDIQSNYINAVKLVNNLLYLNMSVYWLAEPLSISVDGKEWALASGDFVVPFPQYFYSRDFILPSVQYFEKVSTDFNVTILKYWDTEHIHVYPLEHTKVAIFSGGGATGSSLEHINLLEEAGFSLGLVTEENLRPEELSKYNAITFPGGGPYSKYLNETNMQSIRDFVRRGGGFLGTCGGSVLGIELGLLDAELAFEGQYEAYAGLRGAVVLNVSQSSSPIVFGYSRFLESTYFMGPFINRVGNDVKTICSYYCPEDTLLYSSEIMRAYNFSLQAEVINKFWGFPSIISGRYSAGKVVLSTTHPEILPSSQRLFINSILYLSSGEETLLEPSAYQYALKTLKLDLQEDKSLGLLNNTLFSQVRGLVSMLEGRSYNATGVLTGLEEINCQMVGLSAEYLMLFLDDINYRSSTLLVQLDELTTSYEKLENFSFLFKNQALKEMPPLIHSDLLLSIECLQKRILNICHLMLKSGDLVNILELKETELLGEKLLLQQILMGANPYNGLFNLHASESLTLCSLKEDVDYYLLEWSFEMRRALFDAHFLIYFADTCHKMFA